MSDTAHETPQPAATHTRVPFVLAGHGEVLAAPFLLRYSEVDEAETAGLMILSSEGLPLADAAWWTGPRIVGSGSVGSGSVRRKLTPEDRHELQLLKTRVTDKVHALPHGI